MELANLTPEEIALIRSALALAATPPCPQARVDQIDRLLTKLQHCNSPSPSSPPSEFDEWEDEELTREWNRLDGAKYSARVEAKSDAIQQECTRRRIIAWDATGKITSRDQSAKDFS